MAPLSAPMMCPVFVGRTPERATLHQILDRATHGQGHVALVCGEAGIGKSRLVAEAKTSAAQQGFLLFEGHCFQTNTTFPYTPLLDLFRSYCIQHPPDSLAAPMRSVVPTLSRLLPDLALLFPNLMATPAPSSVEPEMEKRQLFAVMTHFLTEQATYHPVLLVVEDIHWCDESSLDLLLHLVRHCRNVPLLVFITYRDDELRPAVRQWLTQLARERLAQELPLGPLSRGDVDGMVRAILALEYPADDDLLDTLVTLSEGNPFFVEELLKSLMTTGELTCVDGVWKCTFRQPSIPRTIQDIVHQRTEHVSADAKLLLRVAAIAGQHFDFPLLQQVLHRDEDHVLPLLKEVIAAQLVVEKSADQFAFRHTLIRQAISSELLARERKSLHYAIADALEALSPSPSQRKARLADLASHFYQAGAWTKVLEYGQRAGEEMLALYAPHAALEHLTHALDAAQHLQIEPSSEVYYTRGKTFETLGDFDRARSNYERALDISRRASNAAMEWQSMLSLGFLWTERDYTTAGAWFRQALDLTSRLAHPARRARTLNRIGNWLENTGCIDEGLEAHQEALSIFEEQHDAQGMAETLDLLGITYGMRGDRVSAVEHIEQAITLFRTLDDTQSLMSCLAMRAVQSMPSSSTTTYSPLRTRDACMQDALESLHLARQVGSLTGQAFAENTLAHTLLSFGEFGPALSHAQASQRVATEIEHQQWIVATSFALGHIYTLLLVPASAIAALETGLSLAREIGSMFWITMLAAYLGRAYVLSQDLPKANVTLQALMPCEQHPRNVAQREVSLSWGELMLAQGEYRTALQIAEHLLASAPEQVRDRPTQPIPHLLKLKGEALMALARPDEAITALEDARRGAQERNARPVLWTIHRSLAQAYQLVRRDALAYQEASTARQLLEELAATIDDVSLRDQFQRAALATFPQLRPPRPRDVARQAFGGLTAREREVAALITQGKTSREIAVLLVISERTAEVHVSNILGKLGFTSRAQIAVWAVEHGLAKP